MEGSVFLGREESIPSFQNASEFKFGNFFFRAFTISQQIRYHLYLCPEPIGIVWTTLETLKKLEIWTVCIEIWLANNNFCSLWLRIF